MEVVAPEEVVLEDGEVVLEVVSMVVVDDVLLLVVDVVVIVITPEDVVVVLVRPPSTTISPGFVVTVNSPGWLSQLDTAGLAIASNALPFTASVLIAKVKFKTIPSPMTF